MKKNISNLIIIAILILSFTAYSNNTLNQNGLECCDVLNLEDYNKGNCIDCNVYNQTEPKILKKVVSECNEYNCRLIGFNSSVTVYDNYIISLHPTNDRSVRLNINGHITPDLSPNKFIKETPKNLEDNESMGYRKGEEGNYFKSDKYISKRDVILPGKYQYKNIEIYAYSKSYGKDSIANDIRFSFSKIQNNDTEKIKCIGCEVNDACYDFKTRWNKTYCSNEEIFKPQKELKEICSRNHECGSYLCFSNKCTRRTLAPFILAWNKIRSLFK